MDMLVSVVIGAGICLVFLVWLTASATPARSAKPHPTSTTDSVQQHALQGNPTAAPCYGLSATPKQQRINLPASQIKKHKSTLVSPNPSLHFHLTHPHRGTYLSPNQTKPNHKPPLCPQPTLKKRML